MTFTIAEEAQINCDVFGVREVGLNGINYDNINTHNLVYITLIILRYPYASKNINYTHRRFEQILEEKQPYIIGFAKEFKGARLCMKTLIATVDCEWDT